MWQFGIKITVDLRVNGMENTARQHRGVLGACKTQKKLVFLLWLGLVGVTKFIAKSSLSSAATEWIMTSMCFIMLLDPTFKLSTKICCCSILENVCVAKSLSRIVRSIAKLRPIMLVITCFTGFLRG